MSSIVTAWRQHAPEDQCITDKPDTIGDVAVVNSGLE